MLPYAEGIEKAPELTLRSVCNQKTHQDVYPAEKL